MMKNGIITLALAFSLPLFAAERWIDVRIPAQYQQEHIQGAVNIPLQQLKETIVTQVADKNETIKLYCNAGRQSALARQVLLDLGYTQVVNAGGINRIDMPKVRLQQQAEPQQPAAR